MPVAAPALSPCPAPTATGKTDWRSAVEVLCPERLDMALAHAKDVGAADILETRLARLADLAGPDGLCRLYDDFAPHSFGFSIVSRSTGRITLAGGLIHSAPTQPLDGSSPTRTVGIGIDSSKPTWSIHT